MTRSIRVTAVNKFSSESSVKPSRSHSDTVIAHQPNQIRQCSATRDQELLEHYGSAVKPADQGVCEDYVYIARFFEMLKSEVSLIASASQSWRRIKSP